MSETLSAILTRQSRGRAQPALYIGLAGDAPHTPSARISLAGIDRIEIARVETGRARSITRSRSEGTDLLVLALADARMSSQHARMTRVAGSWAIEDLRSKNGTWVGGKRIERATLGDGDAILVGHTMLVFRERGGELPDALAPAVDVLGFRTLSPALAATFGELAAAARSPVPIEITGETGTGKELVARAVHELSGRAGHFVPVNCGALPPALFEAELFGHRKGAYTGAVDDRAGLVRSADRGTLFLDEVAELPAPSQAALLRVLHEGEVLPLGADRAIPVDVRIVSATHRALDTEVAAGRFRADLRARLLGVQLALPPLRDRREDLGMLVATLLERVAPDRPIAFSADAVAALYAFAWPLNIRQLERALAAAVAVARDRIDLDHLPAAVRDRGEPVDVGTLSNADRELRDRLVEALARHGGNVAAVARELGKDRTQIRRWMKRVGLERDE